MPTLTRRLHRSFLRPLAPALLLAAACCSLLASCATTISPARRAAGSIESLAPPTGDLTEVELSTVGWDDLTGSPVVLLREVGGSRILPIWIGLAEAQAIARHLHDVEVPRPMTHDLTVDLLHHLRGQLQSLVVTKLREGTFYGLLQLRLPAYRWRRARDLWVDTRPSDGLALALRTGAPIRVVSKLLEDSPDFRFRPPGAGEQVVRALGLTVVAVTPERAAEHGLPTNRPGLLVIASQPRAREQGLERGDLIVTIEGRDVRQPVDLLDAIAEAAGSRLAITLLRNGDEHTAWLDLENSKPKRRRDIEV